MGYDMIIYVKTIDEMRIEKRTYMIHIIVNICVDKTDDNMPVTTNTAKIAVYTQKNR